jgi:RNA polymerase sigma factor (sigma-70 family)
VAATHHRVDETQRRRETLTVVRCQLGERRAFRDLIEQWQRPLYGYVMRMAPPDRADDIVQDVWLKVVRGLPRLRDPVAFPSWLFSIARRSAADSFRSDAAEPADPVADLPDEPFDDLDAHLTSEVVTRAIDRLEPMEREVIHLYYLSDLAIKDIADVVGAPEGTVKSRLDRARRRLTPLLSGLDDTDPRST